MMRLWRDTYTKPALAVFFGGATVSIITHATVITAWVIATLPSAGVADTGFANRAYYIPPIPQPLGLHTVHETVHYVNLAQGGEGVAPRQEGHQQPAPATPPDVGSGGTAGGDTVTSQQAEVTSGHDSVFTDLQVDTAVVRMANSIAPAYPADLLAQHVTGAVSAQYIVDTTGFADPRSFTVLATTNAAFANAVRVALPYMRFQPAKIGKLKVRQLVQQEFTFRIVGDTTASASHTASAKRKP